VDRNNRREYVTPQEEVERAERARQILQDPFFKEHVGMVRDALQAGILKTAFVDEKLREKLTQRWSALEDVISALRSTMETGKLAAKQLELEEQQRSWREKAKQFFG
jgi:hypothetical protein